ncbi:hypothetical protein OIU76_024329 [Salix suchowensis]|uniref:Uncharacterized protein n=1 Tax=Salix suchowensis TaxID=1278906 RepID=A0ABQ9B1W5_9ROSI|nr:E3 ubiquitin-protein ligase [Salix suchowensis]KAG5241130.1 E3 ubiquitin-protein ligase [Salix suchowensis]KAJ6288318.1 hypothetical protein OIU76_024329 [Salix suchowensis]KAJ6367218.1 hypothetical protein OIU77_003563 [Salix suchowensis]KAJ6378932.1 hypothetical protein OIU78_029029 [Salix suchowensis]
MGASESSLSSSQQMIDEITTVTERSEALDPVLEKLKSLKITRPILTSPLKEEGSLTDILVRKASSSSAPATVNPNVLLELFSVYRDWQEGKVQQISTKQEEIENKIEVVDALAIKLLQRFNYSVSAMKTSSQHLSEVHSLQVEIGELKGRLTEVISNCDALCKRIDTEGPESLRSSFKPFATAAVDSEIRSSSSSVLKPNQPSNEAKSD